MADRVISLNRSTGVIKTYKLPNMLYFIHECKKYTIGRMGIYVVLYGWGNTFYNDFIKDNARIYDMIKNKESDICVGKLVIRGKRFTHIIHEHLIEHILRFYSVDESIINNFTHIEYHNITRIPINDDYLEFHIKSNKINASKFAKIYGKDDVFIHSCLDNPNVNLFGKTKNDITKIGLNFGNDVWINVEFIYLINRWINPDKCEIMLRDVFTKFIRTNWMSYYEEIVNTNITMDNIIVNKCSICLNDIYCMNDYKTECGHHFHKKCIRDNFLLYRCDKCPICMDMINGIVYRIPKRTIRKYRKLLPPFIQGNEEKYRDFFKKHLITQFNSLLV